MEVSRHKLSCIQGVEVFILVKRRWESIAFQLHTEIPHRSTRIGDEISLLRSFC